MAGLDLVIANARLDGHASLMDVGIAGGRIAAIEPGIAADAPREDAGGRLLTRGLVDCHIHLDKAELLDRFTIVEGTLGEAVRETARLKAGFTVEDVHARASRVVERAILNGTMMLRTFVEVDPRAGLRSFEAIKAVRAEYAAFIDIQICAFPQEGITNEPETEALLVAALEDGADLVGGCSYADPNPAEHIRRIFDLAQRFEVDADFHVDFDLKPEGSDLPAIIKETVRRGWQGRVACGHVTKLAAWPAEAVREMARRLADAGIAVVALPATDLFLLGRGAEMLEPRGVAPLAALAREGVLTAVASNNVCNLFTPYGDANPVRMANLFANVAHLASDAELAWAFAMISADAARAMGWENTLAVGAPADLLLFDAPDAGSVVRRLTPPLAGWRSGRQTFARPEPTILL